MCPWLVWLPACLEPRALLVGMSLCALLVRVGWKWLPACLGGWCVLVCLGACALLVGVLGWCGYLHALVVRALVVRVVGVPWFVCPWLKWLPGYLEPRVPGWCVLGWK